MFKAYLKWFIINGLMFSLFLYGNIYDNENIINIPIFFAWIASILSWFMVSDENVSKRIDSYNNGKKFVNKNINFIFDMFFLFSILYYGYIGLSIFYFIYSIIIYSFKTKVEEGAKNVQ